MVAIVVVVAFLAFAGTFGGIIGFLVGLFWRCCTAVAGFAFLSARLLDTFLLLLLLSQRVLLFLLRGGRTTTLCSFLTLLQLRKLRLNFLTFGGKFFFDNACNRLTVILNVVQHNRGL